MMNSAGTVEAISQVLDQGHRPRTTEHHEMHSQVQELSTSLAAEDWQTLFTSSAKRTSAWRANFASILFLAPPSIARDMIWELFLQNDLEVSAAAAISLDLHSAASEDTPFAKDKLNQALARRDLLREAQFDEGANAVHSFLLRRDASNP